MLPTFRAFLSEHSRTLAVLALVSPLAYLAFRVATLALSILPA